MFVRRRVVRQPYSFLVLSLDDRIISQDQKGRVRFRGTDATEVIQSSLDGLTEGRTWKETVEVKGIFTINNPIKIPSYTTLDLTKAQFKVPDNTFINIIENKDLTGGNKQIEILGGFFDGNRANNPDQGDRELQNAIFMNRCTEVTIEGCSFYNTPRSGVMFHELGDLSLIYGTYSYNCREHVLLGGKLLIAGDNDIRRVTVAYNRSESNTNRSIALLDRVYDSIIIGNYARNCAESHWWSACINCTMVGNIALNPSPRGITLYAGGRNTLIGNVTKGSTGFPGSGLDVYDTVYNTIIGHVSEGNVYGIVERGASNYNRFIGGVLRGNTTANLSRIGAAATNTSIYVQIEGYNPLGYISPDPTWGASPWTYTNTDSVTEDIYMSVATEGDVSAITKDGQDLPLPGTAPTYICRLEPGESIVITYTTAGTLKRFGF